MPEQTGYPPIPSAALRRVQRGNAEIARQLAEGTHPIQIQRESERRLFQATHPRDAAGRFTARRTRTRTGTRTR